MPEKLKIWIDPRFIPAAARPYASNPIRVFIEYVDNALDSAEKHFFDKESNSYTKPIIIDVTLNKKECKGTIKDNCRGIEDIKRVVNKIGDSNRRDDVNQNGQFGFGMQSFLSLGGEANKTVLEVVSKVKGRQGKYIKIPTDAFYKGENAEIDLPQDADYEYESGTLITISKIGKEKMKELEISTMIEKISKHFEQILKRGNLVLRINDGNFIYTCKPFDYDEYKGEVYQTEIEYPFINGNPKVKIFLKTTEDVQLNRPPFFVIKGRRIDDVIRIKKFMQGSKFKKKIRENPNLTGYIDLGAAVEPILDRTDIEHTVISQAIFEGIYSKEKEIDSFLEAINRKSSDKHYNNLSDYLEKALAKLAKIDRMNYNQSENSGIINDININTTIGTVGGIGGELGNGAQNDNNGNTNDSDETRSIGQGEGEGFGPNGSEGNDFPGEEPEKDSKFKGGNGFGDLGGILPPKPKSGFAIQFVDGKPPIYNDNGKEKDVRSDVVGGTIRIYKEHEDFKERLSKSQNGLDQISQRLITYLAGEITVHYKDEFYNKNKQQNGYSKKMFVSLVDFIYAYENLLKDLVGKNLSDI